MFLEKITNPSDLKILTFEEMIILAQEIRELIIDVVSETGGHLASSLGVVELTIALHYIFNTPEDKIIWDVGHQSYAHKIITGRRDAFRRLRKFNGISGFPRITESVYDSFSTGHSSTSLSLAIGEAVANELTGRKKKVIAVIGDGSISGGMAFEALNHIGHLKNDVLIILNDNEHSISRNVGALSRYLIKMITDPLYNKMRKRSFDSIKKIPRYGFKISNFLNKVQAALKGVIMPGLFFEELGIRYFGPVDGHEIKSLIETIDRIKDINSGPKILHVITKKGKGYKPAEEDPQKFHGIGPFDRETGNSKPGDKISYSEIVGKTLAHMAETDKKVVAITAAMKLGTGLSEFEKTAPERVFDVGIAEQHAVTFAGAMALRGLKPFVSIYSTFLQRAADQLIHDIGIMRMPIKLLIDRAGIVGDDGETHHGLFDISIIRNIPNFVLLAPSSGEQLRDMLYFALDYNKGPVAIRFPRGRSDSEEMRFDAWNKFIPGKIDILEEGNDIALIAAGDMIDHALKIGALFQEKNIQAMIINLLSVKPLDVKGIEQAIDNTKCFLTIENAYICGGIGEYILSNISCGLREKYLFPAGFPDEFIVHGNNDELFQKYSIDVQSVFEKAFLEIQKRGLFEKQDPTRRLSLQ